ncbi:MAG TPA: molybdopterin-dependent oxidoreductase, partial [Iamia sp.]|nr:molybdopterin-dependent oxidoreductase [Iamia sp.]
GVASFTTANRDFYRIDKNISPLQVKTDGYSLTVKGMVDKELEIPWEDLIARDMREYDITMTCVSNLIGGNLVGNARWLGFPLKDLLDEAGVGDGVDQVVGRSADDYTGGFPLEAAYDRDAIVAIGMNGEPLPIAHGFPVRLVVPGLYGYIASVKWLTEIELTRFADFDSYWVRRDYADQAPVKTMSRIDTPKSLSKPEPGMVPIAGVAWAQTRGIDKVEVQIDDAEWVEAELAEALGTDTWRQWMMPAELDEGFHTIKVRATDGDGELQLEERADPLPDGASGWHTIRVSVQA